MAYDEGAAQRIREALEGRMGIAERRMFGGLAFMSKGHMFVGVLGERLVVRVGAAAQPAALGREGVRVMDFTGRPMKGYVYVDPPAYASDADLAHWVAAGLEFTATLPPKQSH